MLTIRDLLCKTVYLIEQAKIDTETRHRLSIAQRAAHGRLSIIAQSKYNSAKSPKPADLFFEGTSELSSTSLEIGARYALQNTELREDDINPNGPQNSGPPRSLTKPHSTFKNPRYYELKDYPKLPQGYSWKTQIEKYCEPNLVRSLRIKPSRKHGWVFCHRGLYDHAMKVPENSRLAVENGVELGLLLHEVDIRFSRDPWLTFLAHDEHAGRVTGQNHNWTSISSSKILEMPLVAREYSDSRRDFASSFLETGEKVAYLADILGTSIEDLADGRCFQLDLRGADFPRAFAHFQQRRLLDSQRVILKGYNFEFASYEELKFAAAALSGVPKAELDRNTSSLIAPIIIVFYSKPLIEHALRAKRIDPDLPGLDVSSNLDFQDVYDVLMTQVQSFLRAPNLLFIPEIAHSGLGLGYNMDTKQAVNPLDGEAITDPEVIFESVVDRAMIEVALDLRKTYPDLYFSSCTRLCEVRTYTGQDYVADIKTGRLKPKLEGDKGLSAKLRSIHGGLYPQSQLVVADDPLAEIAARTWLDEYAKEYTKLDRSQLLHMPYYQWVAQAGPEIEGVVKALNGPFLPNTIDGDLEDNLNLRMAHSATIGIDVPDNSSEIPESEVMMSSR